MSTSTVAIAVQMEGTAKAANDLATVDAAVKAVERGATEAGNSGAGLAVGLGKAENAARKLAGVKVWDSYKQGVTEAKSSTEALAKSLGTVRAAANASNLKSHNAEIERMSRLCGVSTSSMAGLVRQMDAVRRAEAFDNLQRQAGLSTAEMAKLRYQLGDTSGAMKAFGAAALPVVGTVAAVGASALYMGKACFDAGLQLDRLNKSYTSITGASQGAAAQLDYMYGVTDKLGLQFQVTAESAKGFFAAGEGTSLEKDLNGIFEGVSTAASALSLSQDQVSRTFTALGQMISKGKVSSEELRQQFGEHIPGALDLASKAMGVSTAQLNKMMERGELMAEDLLPKLAHALKDKYAAGAIEASDGAQAAVNRMSTEWERFKASASNTELAVAGINAVTGALKGMTAAMDADALDKRLKEAGSPMKGIHTSGNGLRQEHVYTDSQRRNMQTYGTDDSYEIAERQRIAAIRERQKAGEVAAAKEAENTRVLIENMNKYTGALKETKLAKAETEYAAVANPLKEMLASGKGDAEVLKKQLALVDKAYADTLKKINDEGKGRGTSTFQREASTLNAYKTELDKTLSSVSALKAQLEVPAGDAITRDQIKIAKEYEQALADIEKEAAAYAGKNGIFKAQAEELKTQKLLEAELKKTLALRDAETKNAEVRLDFEKRYADMVGATSQGIIDSIRKQSAEYAASGADRVRLAEWERDQIQRASHEAWDGAAVAMRVYSAEASNQAKGMNEAFGSLFSGMDSGFSNMWADLLEDGKVSLSSFKSLFASFLSDLMHIAVTRPITVSIAGAMSGGLFGGSGTANAAGQMMSGGGGGFGIPNVPVSSFLPDSWTSGLSGFMGTTLPGTYSSSIGLTSGSLSTSALQNAGALPGAGTYTGAAGGLGLGSALGYGALGGLGYSMLGGALGLPQGKYSSLTSSLGGTLGAWGGSALASSGLAAGSGLATGAAFGSVIPVVGTILGALGGGLLGSMFGGKKPKKPAVWGGIELNLGDELQGFDFGSTFDPKGYGKGAYALQESEQFSIATRSRNKADNGLSDTLAQMLREISELGLKQAQDVQSALPESYAAAFKDQLSQHKVSGSWDLKGDDINEENFKQIVADVQNGINASMLAAFQGMDFSEYAGKINVDKSAIEGLNKFTQALKITEEAISATAQITNPLSQIEQEAKAAKAQLDEWSKAMQAAGVTTQYAGQLVGDYNSAMIGKFISDIETSLNPLSQYAQAQKNANDALDDRIAALKILGATEEQLAQVEGMRWQVLEAALGPMRTAFDQDMQLRHAQLAGDADSIASLQMTIQHERELADIRAKFGAESVQFAQMQYMQIAEAAQLAWQQQQAAAQKLLQEQANAAQEALGKVNAALSSAQSELNATRNAYLSALNKEASGLKATVDAVSRAVEQLSRTRRDMLMGADSPLGVDQRYALAGAELESVFAKATSGDEAAMSELATLSSKYLDVSKEANADFSKYRKDFERVQTMLAAVEASGVVQKDAAQKQLDAINAQIAAASEGTAQIVGSIKELEAAFLRAMGDYNAAQEAARKAQEAAEEARRKAEEAANNAANSQTPKTWMQDVLERKAEAMNRGETLAGSQTAGGWTPERVLQDILSVSGSFAAWYAQYGKFEGFAKGGLAMPGWAIVGEQGPELVNFSQPGRVYTADDTAEMLNPSAAFRADSFQASTFSMPAPVPVQSGNSNAELIREIKALRKEVADLRAEQSRSQFRIADATQRTARKLEQFDYDGLPEPRKQ